MAWLAFGREREVKDCAARRIIGGPQMAPMLFDDGAAYRQTNADTTRFRGEERIENLIWEQRRQSNAGIADGHRDLSIFRSLRRYGKLPCPVLVVHCLDAVDHEVHQNLLQLHAI